MAKTKTETPAGTLTWWWEALEEDLDKLKPKVTKSDSPPWVAAGDMAKHGKDVEKSWPPTQLSLKSKIEENAKNLGIEDLPDINNPEQLVFAILYCQHLKRFEKITVGNYLFLKGVHNEDGRVQGSLYKLEERINAYLDNKEHVKKVKEAFPGITTVLGESLTEPVDNWLDLLPAVVEVPTEVEEASVVEEITPPKTLEELLNAVDIDILTNADKTMDGRLDGFESRVKDLPDSLTVLARARTRKNELEPKIKQLKGLQEAIVSDEQSKYFLELISDEKNQKDFNNLMDAIKNDDPDKVKLLNTIEQLKNPSLSQAFLYLTGSLRILPASFFPDIDNENKALLKKLVNAQIELLSAELVEMKQVIEIGSIEIANGNKELKELILSCEPQKLIDLSEELSKTKQDKLNVVSQYREIYDTVVSYSEALQRVKGLDNELDNLIKQQNHGIGEMLSNLFARLLSFLISGTVSLKEEENTFKEEMSQFIVDYEEKKTKNVANIKQMKNIPDVIKDSLIQQLESTITAPVEPAPSEDSDEEPSVKSDKGTILDMQIKFAAIRGKFFQTPEELTSKSTTETEVQPENGTDKKSVQS